MWKAKVSLFVFVLILALPIAVYANPYMPDLYRNLNKEGNDILSFLTASVSLLLEYLVVRRLLSPQVELGYVLPAFVVINVVTFPLTLFVGLFIGWFAELIPLLLEPVLYREFFQRIKVEVPHLTIKIVAANLFSFLFGLVAYYHIFPYIKVTFYH